MISWALGGVLILLIARLTPERAAEHVERSRAEAEVEERELGAGAV